MTLGCRGSTMGWLSGMFQHESRGYKLQKGLVIWKALTVAITEVLGCFCMNLYPSGSTTGMFQNKQKVYRGSETGCVLACPMGLEDSPRLLNWCYGMSRSVHCSGMIWNV